MTRPPVALVPPEDLDIDYKVWIAIVLGFLIIAVIIGVIFGYDGEDGRQLYSH
jgi:hypothetical protein